MTVEGELEFIVTTVVECKQNLQTQAPYYAELLDTSIFIRLAFNLEFNNPFK